MRRAQGYATLTTPEGVKEYDTFTCGHCNSIVHVPPAPQPMPGGQCRLCMKLICTPCVDTGKCDPFERKLERMESRDRFRKQAGI